MALRAQGRSPFRYYINEGPHPAFAHPTLTRERMDATQRAVRAEIAKAVGGYDPSRLVNLHYLAQSLGLESILVKDEGTRFTRGAQPDDDRGLIRSFKPLGALAAVGPLIEQYGRDGIKMLASATDGNHGLGLAWVAKQLGFPCTIYVPRETIKERKEAIARLGAEVVVSKGNYDQACRDCRTAVAGNTDWFEVSDVSTRDYQQVPTNIMLGYTLIVAEFLAQINPERPPQVVFLQAGVGTMAGALTAALRTYLGHLPPEEQPKIVVCEPVRAAGIFHYMTRGGRDIERGTPYRSDLRTKAAGLSCGMPAYVGFEVLRSQADAFVTVPESVIDLAAYWMLKGSATGPITAGESGAFGLAAFLAVIQVPALRALKIAVGLDQPERRVLVINTEGATNERFAKAIAAGRLQGMPKSYRRHFAAVSDFSGLT